MKPLFFVKLALAFSTLSVLSTPALAQISTTASTQTTEQATLTKESMEIPIFFPTDITVDIDNTEEFPITLFLAQDLMDVQGNLLAPVNSFVRAQLNPSEDGLQIVAESIVVAGQSIPLRATSSLLPSTTVTQTTGDQNGQRQAARMRDIAGGIAGALGADLETSDQVSFGGSVIGFLVGSSSPQQVREVRIPAGTVHLLKLD